MAGDAASNAAMAAAMAAVAARGAGAGASRDQRVLTGSDGRFFIYNLPAGQYQISATLCGYSASLAPGPGAGAGAANVTLLMAAGGRGMGANTVTTHTVADGEALRDVSLRLWKHASISGTVFDEAGEPAVGITVQAMRRTMVGGRARYILAGVGRTDDRGIYRIGSLLPADYVIVTQQAQLAVPAAMIEKIVSIGVTGQVDTDQTATAALLQLMATPGANVALPNGVRLGGYLVAGGGGALPIVGPNGRLSAYGTAFHANARTPVEATILPLRSGEERTGADLHLTLTPTVTVSGVAAGPDGPVANLAMRLIVPGDRVASDTEFDVASSVTTSDGRFAFYGVPPGQFLLRAQRNPLPGPVAFAAPGQAPPPPALFAMMDLAVGTRDIDNLTVALSEAFSLSGRVEFESETGKAPPAALKGAGLMLLPADGQTPTIFAIGRPTPLDDGGTFTRTGLAPARYFLSLTMPPPWQVKSATLNGRDVYDAPLEIRTGNVANVLITATDRLAQLSGTVTASGSYKPGDATIIVFPANHEAWIDNGMNPRLVRTTRVSAAGTYTVANLTAGDYLVVAIDRSEEGDVQDPAFIEALARAGTRVSMTAEARTQALTVARVRR